MQLPEPFHSAKMSSWPSLMRDPAVSPYAKDAARAFVRAQKQRLRPQPVSYRAAKQPKPSPSAS
jgi:hypothetical protein